MLKNWLRRWLGVAEYAAPLPPVQIIAPTTPEEKAKTVITPGGGFFSTNNSMAGQQYEGQSLVEWLKSYASLTFQRTHTDIQTVQTVYGADGAMRTEAMAMDWAGSGTANAYDLGGGSPIPGVQIAWYAAQSFIGYQMCAILAQHWFIDKACTMPARDATRNGWTISAGGAKTSQGTENKIKPEVVEFIAERDTEMGVKAKAMEFVRNCRIFGIRIALYEVKSSDPQYYEKPFNIDGVKPGSYEGISQVDPYWITPELDFNASANPASRHFYEPTWWRINGRRYHRSHLVIIKTCEVSDVLKPTYFYGGIPLPQRIYERCYAAERTTNEAPQLALSKRSTIIHADLDAAAGNQVNMNAKLQQWAYYRDNFGVKVLGIKEDAEQFDTTLTDLDVTIMTQWQVACAIAEVPATKMMGTQTKGLGNGGEAEEANYHEMLESTQEHDVLPFLDRHYLLLMKSEVQPKFGSMFKVKIEFEDLDAETAKEKADRHLAESTATKNLFETGAIDGIDIRAKLQKDPDSGWNDVSDVMPVGPEPRTLVQPGAPTTAPNTPPGEHPASAPATVAATAPQSAGVAPSVTKPPAAPALPNAPELPNVK